MTLRNCWGWRFNGGVFTDAREDNKQPAHEALLENNRRALLRILQDKIDQLRKPYQPACLLGHEIRQYKHAEARAYVSDGGLSTYTFLEGVAVAHSFSLAEAAQLITKRAEQTESILQATEKLRERFSLLITQAQTEKDLLQLRNLLLDDVYPELTRQFKFTLRNTEPLSANTPLSLTHRVHERARLRVQLREKINEKRAAFHSHYAHNEEMIKLKAQLARWALNPSGPRPAGMEILESLAQARQLSLEEIAQQVLGALDAAGRCLVETEIVKDRLLAQIDAMASLHDIQATEIAIANIGNP